MCGKENGNIPTSSPSADVCPKFRLFYNHFVSGSQYSSVFFRFFYSFLITAQARTQFGLKSSDIVTLTSSLLLQSQDVMFK